MSFMAATPPPPSAQRQPRAPFFVGWLKIPKALRPFLAIVAAGLIGLLAGLAFALGAATDDPGDGRFRWDLGPQRFVGVLEATPYPLLHLTEPSPHARSRTLLLAGVGKAGVQDRAVPLDGTLVETGGILLQRGSIDMLQVGQAGIVPVGADAADGAASPAPAQRQAGTQEPAEAQELARLPAQVPAPVALGRWRIAGELCDGKCYAGAMRPGDGLAHKACANLCLLGGLPLIFVTTRPVEGAEFLLVADPDGDPVPDAYRDYVALLVELEGDLERRGDILVFKVDITTAKIL